MKFTRTGTIASIQVVTQGIAGADFSDARSGGCAVGQTYSTGQQCTVGVSFKPIYPGQRSGAALITASDGSLLASSLLAGSATGGLSVIAPGRIDTVIGNGAWIYRGDDLAATSTSIFLPMGEAVDAGGNLYLSDSNNNRVRRVDANTGLVSTIAGTGAPGISGDGGPALSAMVSSPAGLILDGAGNLYFADSANHAVRRLDVISHMITTVAGTLGVQGYTGDLGPATSSRLSFPDGIAFDTAHNLLIADTGNNVIRKVDTITGVITTVAGTGAAGFSGDGQMATSAELNTPWSVAAAPDGSFYVADLTNNRIRKVDAAGLMSSVAGNGARDFSGDGMAATSAALNAPASIVLDPAGNLYIADSGNNRVRRVNAATGIIQSIVGGPSDQFAGDTGPADVATLYGPYSLFFDGPGNLYVSDMFHNRIRKVSSTIVALHYAAIRVSKTSPPQPEALENDGNADLNLAPLSLDNAALDGATTTCTVGIVSPANSCALGVEFAPTVVGSNVQGSLTLTSDAGNSPAVINLSGEVLTVEPTTIALTSSANPGLVSTPITVKAVVSSADPSRTGTVLFTDGTTQLCSVALDANGSAVCSVAALALGQHQIIANYSGDSNNAASTSRPLTETIRQPSTLVLQITPNPAIASASVIMNVAVSAATGVPGGLVIFFDGGTPLASVNLASTGIATFSTLSLSVGIHKVSVSYSGDGSNASGRSNSVQLVIVQASTVTSLSSPNTTADVGTNVTLNAAVTSNGGPTPTGTVAFSEGSTSLGSSPLNASAGASVTLSTLTPGTHLVTAIYSGDTNNSSSISTVLTESVQQLGTVTGISSDSNPANAGSIVHLTANVTGTTKSTSGGPINGLVSFQEGAASLGAAKLNDSGTATVSISTLAVGQHTITAVYQANTNYSGSSSGQLIQLVKQSSTTTILSSNNTSSIAGTPVTVTASVSSTGVATGNVIFKDGNTVLSQTAVDAQGRATLTTASFPVGPHTITATYTGDVNYLTSTSSPLLQVVSIATTSLTLSASANPVQAGAPMLLTPTLSGNGGQPTGPITITDGATVIFTQPVSGVVVSFDASSLAIGPHTLRAFYSGDANNSASVSIPLVVFIQQDVTSVSLQSSQNPVLLNQALTISAIASSAQKGLTGGITFSDGPTVLGTVPLGASGLTTLTISSLTIGSHSLTATYSGDTLHAPSSSTALTQQVVQSAAISVSSSANPSVAGLTVSLTVKVFGVSSISPTGTVTFLEGSTVLGTGELDGTGVTRFQSSTLPVGQHSIIASYAGDRSYQAVVSSPLLETIRSADNQVAMSSSANPSIYHASLVLRATVTGNGGSIAGTVTFTEGSTILGLANVDANGVASITTATIAPGKHAIVATYMGDSRNSAATSPLFSEQVQQLTTTSLASSLNPASTLSSLVLTSTVSNGTGQSPTGIVTFTDGATVLGRVDVDPNGVAALTLPALSAGNHTLQTTYSGDAADFSSISSLFDQAVSLRPTTNALTASATSLDGGQQETLIALLRWNGPVAPSGLMTFKTGGNIIGTATVDKTGVATLTIVLGSPTENILATYGGDTVYAASDSPLTSIASGLATQFTMMVTPPTLTLQTKQHSTVDLTITSIKGFSDTMSLGCLGLPFAATCTFSTDNARLQADGNALVHVVVDTGSPLTAGGQARAVTNSRSTSLTTSLCFLPCGALLALLLFRPARLRPLRSLLLMLVVATVVMQLSGCGSIAINGTPPGNYVFKISASGKQTGITQTQSVTLTVTQ